MTLPGPLRLPAALMAGGLALIVLGVALGVPQVGLAGVSAVVVGLALLIRAALSSLGDHHE